MARLSESDVRRVLDVVREASVVDGPQPFPEPVLDALRRLVPCDVVAYHERWGQGPRRIVWTGEPRGPTTPEVRAAGLRYEHQDPLTPVDGVRKCSDFFSRREFHRLPLYQEVARPVGVEDMIRLWLDPRGEGEARLEFDRGRRDFRERDRAVLDALLPDLKRFRRDAVARRELTGKRANEALLLSPRQTEILKLVAAGKTNAEIASVLWVSPGTVRKHLENAYEKLGVHTRTAAVAAVFQFEVNA